MPAVFTPHDIRLAIAAPTIFYPSSTKERMNFSEIALSPEIQKAIEAEGYTQPTPIQAKAIPEVLNGRDLIGCAQTGTGKTAAFALPILELLLLDQPVHKVHHKGDKQKRSNTPIRALILSPTRELAQQIGDSFDSYGRYTGLKSTIIYGGVSQGKQMQALRYGVDILVATPGRLLDLMNQRIVSLNEVEIVVLDEADHMLDMGFIIDIKKILSTLPEKRQSLLFSATMPSEIVKLAQQMLKDPVKIQVAAISAAADPVEQQVYFIDRKYKTALLLRMLDTLPMTSVLVFSRTKHGADRLTKELNNSGVPAEAIHGDKAQTARQRALNRFKERRSRVLVATDIAARGIDVEELPYVVNYDMPDAAETYVHRIGRTGRAGLKGTAISFCANDERDTLRHIKRIVGNNAITVKTPESLPAWTPRDPSDYPEPKVLKAGKHEFIPAFHTPIKPLSKAGAAVQSILKDTSSNKKSKNVQEDSYDIEQLISKREKKSLSDSESVALKLKAEGVDYSIIIRATGISREALIKL